jgi:hypothetical protein
MKKLLLWAVALATGLVAHAQVWWTSNPGSANSGSSYSISAYAGGGSGLTELYIYKNGSFFAYDYGYGSASAGDSTTDYGAQTVYYTADGYFDDWSWSASDYHSVSIAEPNSAPTITWSVAPANVPVNSWVTVEAHGSDVDGNLTNVFVWAEWNPFAFGDGGDGYNKYCGNGTGTSTPGSVTFMAKAVDSYGGESPVIYHTVNFYVPNVAPTITWVNSPPSSVYVNQYFNIQARANDGNGNLAWTHVWRNDQAFAFNDGGNGWEAYSDNNSSSSATPTTFAFKAKAGDADTEESGFIYHNVDVINRDPTVYGSAASAVAGQPITVSWSAGDPDGNLSNVHVWVTQYGSPYWDYIGAFGASGSTSWSSSAHFNSNSPALGAYLFVLRAADAVGAYADYYATFDITNTAPAVPVISASKTGTVTYTEVGMHYEMLTDHPITMEAVADDADGNLVEHQIWKIIYPGGGPSVVMTDGLEGRPNAVPANGAHSVKTLSFTPVVPGRYDFHTNARDAAGVWNLSAASFTMYAYGPNNGADFIEQTVNGLLNPSAISVNPGQTFSVSITMQNNGEKPWTTDGTPHQLSATGNGQASPTVVALPASPIYPMANPSNNTATFNFTATAPSTPGNYTFVWRMNEQSGGVFGEATAPVTVTVLNPPPAGLSATGGTIAYGQSFSTTLSATDAGSDLRYLHLVVANAAFNASANGWEGSSPDGWKWRAFRSDSVTGASATVTVPVQDSNYGTPNPLPAGTYRLTVNAQDSVPQYTYSASSILATLTVTQATPTGTFADRGFSSTRTLVAGDLNAAFANPYVGLPATGAITYSIVSASGPWALPTTGSISVGTILRAGTYVVRAHYPGDANHLPAIKDANFTVGLIANIDEDGDGVNNGLEDQLNLNPYDPANVQVFHYTYDKINQLLTGPGGQYKKDLEGNIKEVRP